MSEAEGASCEMPRYKSHKQVWALEIAEVSEAGSSGGRTLHFEDAGYAPMPCEAAMFSRYMPVAGDYLVQYDDGYKSFSPRKAFLEGYTRERDISKRPTITELEEILREPDAKVHINPDGSVSAA